MKVTLYVLTKSVAFKCDRCHGRVYRIKEGETFSFDTLQRKIRDHNISEFCVPRRIR